LPDCCRFCNAAGTITAESTINGETVVLNWCCRLCGETWPVTYTDQEKRRRAVPDRRRLVREDRRKN